ncbi:MAG: DUF3581 family protein, partial [Haliea sp.]|nr:DUF3581 family protein [Haliea sp.]
STMIIDQFYSEPNRRVFLTARAEGGNFAEQMANDFNPLHDADAKRSASPATCCLPSSLQITASASTAVHFPNGNCRRGTGITGALGWVTHPTIPTGAVSTGQTRGRPDAHADSLIRNLTQATINFLARPSPQILVPLLAEQRVTIHRAARGEFTESMPSTWTDWISPVRCCGLTTTSWKSTASAAASGLAFHRRVAKSSVAW